MKVVIHKNFLKDLSKIPPHLRIRIEKFIFIEISNFKNINEIGKAEKMQGYDEFYKIRFGDYRAGIRYENNEITFERVLHRKDIYRHFPKNQ